MPTQRDMQRLTEDWPDDASNFELAAFAATFHADRPALSGPALDRIGDRMREALDRQCPRPTTGDSTIRWQVRLVRSALRTGRAMAPFATLRRCGLAAAAILLAGGAWLAVRQQVSPTDSAHTPATGPARNGILVGQPAPPDGVPAQDVVVPVVGE